MWHPNSIEDIHSFLDQEMEIKLYYLKLQNIEENINSIIKFIKRM